MTYRQVILSIEGLRDRDLATEHIYRRMTAVISASGFNGKVMRQFNKLWPIKSIGETQDVVTKGKEVLKRLREYQALNSANEKLHGRRSKNNGRRGRTEG